MTQNVLAREKNNEKEINENLKRKETKLIFLDEIRRLTKNEEKLIEFFEELKFACNLFDIKKIIFNFKHLTELTLSYTSLESLPNYIKDLYNLVCLDLSNNELTYLPNTLGHLHQLKYLNLSLNKFYQVPDIIYLSLRFLKILNLSYNEITEFNESPACINNILQFKMSNNALSHLPAWIFSVLCNLQILDLSSNPIRYEAQVNLNPYGPGIYDSLQILTIENCNFTCRKLYYLNYFKSLKILRLGNKNDFVKKNNNFFGNLKVATFKNVKELECLYMENNDIAVLPQDFGKIQNIQCLNLSENMLSWLPDSFCELINLKVIFLNSNQLIFLPENIGNLINLQQIHLSNNKLSKLPPSFNNLNNLKYVDLYNNEIKKIDSTNFNDLSMLSGIDLEMNFLDLDAKKQLDLNIGIEKYCSLKTCFRQQFSKNDRNDLQKINEVSILEERIDTLSDKDLDINVSTEEEEETAAEELSTFFKESKQNVAEENEIWEENSAEDEKHDLFDPNYLSWGDDKFIKCSTQVLRNCDKNYCPADHHPSSLINFCRKNFSLFNEVVEKQFDLE